jgi:hypothetical protein
MPYRVKLADGRTDEQLLNEDIAPQIRQRDDIPFVIHLGDLGRPNFACTDAWLEQTKAFWQHELHKPVFYTPGDNEWLDCDRETLNLPSKPSDRLDAIRRIFFSTPQSLDRNWRYEQQTQLPENQTWWYGGIRFVTQHIVTKDDESTSAPVEDNSHPTPLTENRAQLNQVWLDHAFDMAQNPDTTAVVIATQTDVFGAEDGINDAMSRCLHNPAYQNFCSHLQELAATLNKPVLLIHGDTNGYCLDQPLSITKTPKFWRLNAPGDYQVIDAALIAFDAKNVEQPFKVTGLLSGKAAPVVCDYSRH